jgi:hypothetical protein
VAKRHSARTITGVVTGLQPFLSLFVTHKIELENVIDFQLARRKRPAPLTVNVVVPGSRG